MSLFQHASEQQRNSKVRRAVTPAYSAVSNFHLRLTSTTLADKLYAFHKASQQQHIAALSVPSPTSPSVAMEAELQQIQTRLSTFLESNIKLTSRVAVLEAGLQFSRPSCSSNRSPTPNPRRRSNSRGAMPEDSKLCYYHSTYTGKAENCKPLPDGSPCEWNNLNS